MAKKKVFKIVTSDWPDYPCFVDSRRALEDTLEMMLPDKSDEELWGDCIVQISFEEIEESEFETLEEWCP